MRSGSEPKTMRIPARFRYEADVIPKGSRNIRRAFLHAPFLLEIAVADGEAVEDAVRVRTHDGREVSYLLHGGRLWRPADCDGPLGIDDYAVMARTWPAVAVTHRPFLATAEDRLVRALAFDPVAAATPFRRDIPWPHRGGGDLHAEEEFAGRLLKSDRDESRAACLAAAADVAMFGGHVHYAAPEPVWETHFDGPVQMLAPEADMSVDCLRDGHCGRGIEGWRVFGAERLDDALRFAVLTDPGKPHPVGGEVLHIDRRYTPPPATARAVAGCFHHLFLRTNVRSILPYLSGRGAAAFALLREAAVSLSPLGLGALADDTAHCVEALRTIADELNTGLFPPDMNGGLLGMLETIERALARADFEAKAKPALTADEELSLAAMAAPR